MKLFILIILFSFSALAQSTDKMKCYVFHDVNDASKLAIVHAMGFIPEGNLGECPQELGPDDGDIIDPKTFKIDKVKKAAKDADYAARVAADKAANDADQTAIDTLSSKGTLTNADRDTLLKLLLKQRARN